MFLHQRSITSVRPLAEGIIGGLCTAVAVVLAHHDRQRLTVAGLDHGRTEIAGRATTAGTGIENGPGVRSQVLLRGRPIQAAVVFVIRHRDVSTRSARVQHLNGGIATVPVVLDDGGVERRAHLLPSPAIRRWSAERYR